MVCNCLYWKAEATALFLPTDSHLRTVIKLSSRISCFKNNSKHNLLIVVVIIIYQLKTLLFFKLLLVITSWEELYYFLKNRLILVSQFSFQKIHKSSLSHLPQSIQLQMEDFYINFKYVFIIFFFRWVA